MTKREIMVRAHELARTMEGDYSARLALGLRQAWAEARRNVSGVTSFVGKTRRGKEYTVTFGWRVTDRTIWADGHEVTVKERGFVFDVTSEYGPVSSPRLSNDSEHGPAIVGQVTHNGKRYRLVLQIDHATYNMLTSARDGNQQEVRTTNLCPDCGSACYSDCKAS